MKLFVQGIVVSRDRFQNTFLFLKNQKILAQLNAVEH